MQSSRKKSTSSTILDCRKIYYNSNILLHEVMPPLSTCAVKKNYHMDIFMTAICSGGCVAIPLISAAYRIGANNALLIAS
jgi:hypothetical protein